MQVSLDSSVSIAIELRLDDQGNDVRSLAGSSELSLLHSVQTGHRAKPACYIKVILGFLRGGKWAGRGVNFRNQCRGHEWWSYASIAHIYHYGAVLKLYKGKTLYTN
jgi:hypothetical protein